MSFSLQLCIGVNVGKKMDVYLPIAELSENFFVLVTLGLMAGFLSGMFGVGGGFLLTPLLTFVGVPPAVAVGTQATQLAGTSLAGAIMHWHKKQVDAQMGVVLLGGSLLGTVFGVWLFGWFKKIGHIDLVVSLGYLFLLSFIGILMLTESLKRLRNITPLKQPSNLEEAPHHFLWGAEGSLAITFPASRIRVSVLLPIIIGFASGLAVAMLGIGGSFVLVPAMLYVLRMPGRLVNGTSMFQMVFVTGLATILQAIMNNSVDIVLAIVLLAGSMVGVRFGAKLAGKTKPELARFLLALLILSVAGKLLSDLLMKPDFGFADMLVRL